MKYEDIKKCELVKIQEKNNPFFGIESEVLNEIIELYYTEELTVVQIIDKFGLNIDKAPKFSSYLPFFYTVRKCPYDNLQLVAQLPSKSSLKYFSPDFQCVKCRHTDYEKNNGVCKCNNCQLKEKDKKNRLSTIINNVYRGTEVELQDINIFDRLDIATLFQIINLEFNDLVPQYKTYKRLINSFTEDTLHNLIDQKIIKVSERNSSEIFTNITEQSFSYLTEETFFSLNVVSNHYNEIETFEMLKNLDDIKIDNAREYVRLWRYYVTNELLKIYKFEMEKLGFSKELYVKEKEKMFCKALDRWLELYSPSQIYALLYKSIREADNARTTGTIHNYQYHETKFIIVLVDKMIVKYEHEGWGIKHYDYPNQLELDIQTQLFFMKVIKEKNWFGAVIPAYNEVVFNKITSLNNIVSNYSDYIDKLELQKMDNSIERTLIKARYYYLIPYGIVIDDGVIECLFATSKSLLDYLLHLKNSGRVNPEYEGESVESQISLVTNFYVDHRYSEKLIYLIIKNVIERGIPTFDEWKAE